MTGDNTLIHSHGINRRDFMKLCAALAATMGLSSKAAAEMAESVTNPQRPPVIWIGAQECTGCTESLLRAKPPKLDDKNRPTFAYGRLIHEHCERRPHFDAGRFAKEFGDEGHREGWCLYHLGCKGPETYGNCSTLQFCDVGGVWPVAIGHPCYGCNEEGIGFHKGIHQLANVENQTPRSQKPDVNAKEGGNVSAGAIGLLGGVVGLVAGVSVMAVRELGRQQKKDNADSRGE